MKIKEIIQNPNFMLNTEFLKYKILENKIEATLDLDPNKEVECIYYWYDHFTRGSLITTNIINSLDEKNWEQFKKYLFDEIEHECTLPDVMAVFENDSSNLIGHIILNKNTMEFMVYNEYECG